jgi:hypothetical protein
VGDNEIILGSVMKDAGGLESTNLCSFSALTLFNYKAILASHNYV